MKTVHAMILPVLLCAAAHADFSYTQTRKTTGGMMASMAGAGGPQTSKTWYKGRKMKTDQGSTATIMDFEAQTITTINHAQKTFTVRSFDEIGAPAADLTAKIDVKETGQKKLVNGFNASELLMTMEIDSPQARQMGKMQMEVQIWLSPDVPGSQELRRFYQQNAAKFPWSAVGARGNPAMASALAEMQKKMASMNGVPVEQVIKVKAPGGMPGAPAGMSPAQAAKMQDSMGKLREQMEALKAKGGPGAAIAEQQLARMGPAPGAGGAAASPGSLMEMTMDSSDFSSATIPDSVFSIPDGYRKN